MRVAVIGASGKTGRKLVRESIKRGHQVTALCRTASADKLNTYFGRKEFKLITAPVVSDRSVLIQAIEACDAVASVLISVKSLKATELVKALAEATAIHGVKRLVFTAGEVTAAPDKDEAFEPRQRIMLALYKFITWFTPYSLSDMYKASELVRQQRNWDWTIIRAPALNDSPAAGYRFVRITDIRKKHALSREDYAACIIDSLSKPEHHRRTLAVVSAQNLPV